MQLPRREVFELAEIAACRLGSEENVLAETQGAVRMCRVERDDVREALHGCTGGPVSQIEVEVVLELVDKDDRPAHRLVQGRPFRVAVEDPHLRPAPAHPALPPPAGTPPPP